MERLPEPELMEDEEQALAYAEADFSEPHALFVAAFRGAFPKTPVNSKVLDMGCGPADITVRFARAFPDCTIDAADGSEAMLKLAQTRLAREELAGRICLFKLRFPETHGLKECYDIIISNSLLHHLANPATLWDSAKRLAAPRGLIFVMDLSRPDNAETAKALVEQYASDAPAILQRDFYNSLCAAYRPGEVRTQLEAAGLPGFQIAMVSDRHWVAYNPH
jgi:ubiquinone/menaquinone biosynthesis C-methylase UbiE